MTTQLERDKELVNLILEWSMETGPVEIATGFVTKNNLVNHGIVLKSAPPAIITSLIGHGYTCDLVNGVGLYVYKL